MTGVVTHGPVLLDIDDGIARVRLNRPDAANAADARLLQRLHEVVHHVSRRVDVRVVVLSGEGRVFCAGGDAKAFVSGAEEPGYVREASACLRDVVDSLAHLRPPVIAKVQGFAAGCAGFGLACSADLVVAGEDVTLFSGAIRERATPDAATMLALAALPRACGGATTASSATPAAAATHAVTATITGPSTALATTPVTRRSSVEPCHSSAALDAPILVERPPANTTPTAELADSTACRRSTSVMVCASRNETDPPWVKGCKRVGCHRAPQGRTTGSEQLAYQSAWLCSAAVTVVGTASRGAPRRPPPGGWEGPSALRRRRRSDVAAGTCETSPIFGPGPVPL